ncbi:ABC transporter permease [Caviibacter abscessus]|uniref:ABC transporter permease n=1 Tax=Caviibacter abscessus TaxID=1766719 RepID=UPI00082D7CBB|nr:ABC transporter permease [Caviibacter abscessus]
MKKLKKYSLILLLLILWQSLTFFTIIPDFLLPSPYQVIKAFIEDFNLIIYHTKYTLIIAFIGVFIGIIISFLLSLIMDMNKNIYDIVYPVIIITQTIPTVAIAPLLIIWLGYYMKPKILLVVLTSFFPIVISLLDGYNSVDEDSIKLLKAMGANKYQMYRHLKIPASLGYFFAGLRVCVSYSLISAVVAEWLGGFYGLGVYMTRVRKAYALDKMFAVIFFISFLSLMLMTTVDIIQKKIIKY